ncbi:MAG: c-type cytochrome [Anaerolineales bacterium]|nr:c-type cytochrome [Anaerolineales bacterium]
MKYLPRFLILLTFLLTAACASLAEDLTPPPGYEYIPPPPTQDVMYYPSVPPNPIAGQPIYVEKCQPCHGEQGLGNGPDANELPNPVAPIGTAELARASYPGEWYEVVTEGRIDLYMPPFLSLTERQRWDVLAYVYTLSAPAETVEQGKALYQENCEACHGLAGVGDGPEAVNFGENMPSFGDQLLMSERSKADLFAGLAHPESPEIPDLTLELTESERWALTDYLRELTFAPPVEETAATNPLATVTVEEGTPAVTDPSGETADAPADVPADVPADAPADEGPVGAGQGLVTGQVVNLSGGEVVEGQDVVLHGFDQFQEVISVTTQVAADGIFRFEGVEIPEGRAFIITVDYKDTTYTSDLMVVEAGITAYEMPVSIYETTTDKSGLVIERLHVLFEFISAEQIRVAELIIVSNLSNRVIVTKEDSAILNFSLPDGATNLQFQEGALGRDFIETPSGFGDLRAIVPGESGHQVLFSFDMPYNGSLELSQPMELAVNSLVVLSPDIGVTVAGNNLESGGVQDVQGTPYEVLSGESIPAGENLTLRLDGKPNLGEASAISTGSSSSLAIGLGVLGVALLGVGGWLFRRSSQRVTDEETLLDVEEEEAEFADVDGDAESLMDAIIALDDHFKTGDLPEEAYLRRRAVLKEQLRKQLE